MAAVKTDEDVAGGMDVACVDLIEERHHDQHVEDDRVVLGRCTQVLVLSTAVDVQQSLTLYSNTTVYYGC